MAFKGSTGTQAAGGQPPAVAVDVEDVKIDDNDPYIGDKNAPVTLVVWEDYQCPFCKAVEVGHDQIQVVPAMPELVRDYVKTGKLRIVFKDYAFLGDDSKIAAVYDNAVWKLYPEKYYEWREAMYKAQDEEHAGFGTEATILALIKKIPGMDSAKLKADVTANVEAYTKEADEDRAEGASFGITGTPRPSASGSTIAIGWPSSIATFTSWLRTPTPATTSRSSVTCTVATRASRRP